MEQTHKRIRHEHEGDVTQEEERLNTHYPILTLEENNRDQKLYQLSSSLHPLAASFISDYLKQGANPNICDEHNNTALHRAAAVGNFYNVKILVEAGANVCALTTNRTTILHSAASSHSTHRSIIIKYLIAQGAYKWQTPEYSPLKQAVEQGDIISCISILTSPTLPFYKGKLNDLIQTELLKYKIEFSLSDENDQTMQEIAENNGFNDIADLVNPKNIEQFRQPLKLSSI